MSESEAKSTNPRRPLKICAIVIAAFATACVCTDRAAAQSDDGRGSGGGTTTTPRPRPKKRPKKIIRARAADDVEKVPTASVIIRSHPDGAEVFVDGKMVGTTADDGELELSDMRFGPHLIVLRKDGYREWSQTVQLRSVDPVEVLPLLQDLNAPVPRNLRNLPTITFGAAASGSLTRDDQTAPDGSGYYDEYTMKVADIDAFLIKLAANGFAPLLKIFDDDNRSYDVRAIGEGLYQSVSVPRGGTYFLRITSAIDESSFVGGDYTVTVISESASRASRAIAIGQTESGTLDTTDRASGASDYYDAWTFEAAAGTRVLISARSEAFTPGLTLLLNNSVVATSSSGGSSSKKKGSSSSSGPAIEQTLAGGTYTVYVRSLSGAKVGAYQLSIATATSGK
jgi:hypothetical protein